MAARRSWSTACEFGTLRRGARKRSGSADSLLRLVAAGLVGLFTIAVTVQQADAQIRTQPERDRGGDRETDEPAERGRDSSARSRDAEGQPRMQIAPELRPRPGRGISLGVEVRRAQVGYIITHVLPNTAAWRAGLEPGDRIVTVDGYQVGNVGTRFYDLDRELQLRAGDDLAAVLLVQNVRNQQLVQVPVRFDERAPRRPRLYQEEEAEPGSPLGGGAEAEEQEVL